MEEAGKYDYLNPRVKFSQVTEHPVFSINQQKKIARAGRITYHLFHKAEGGGLPRDPDVA